MRVLHFVDKILPSSQQAVCEVGNENSFFFFYFYRKYETVTTVQTALGQGLNYETRELAVIRKTLKKKNKNIANCYARELTCYFPGLSLQSWWSHRAGHVWPRYVDKQRFWGKGLGQMVSTVPCISLTPFFRYSRRYQDRDNAFWGEKNISFIIICIQSPD